LNAHTREDAAGTENNGVTVGPDEHPISAYFESTEYSQDVGQDVGWRKIVIIGGPDPGNAALNLSLNCHDRVGRTELYLMTALGFSIQTAVVVFSGFTTQYSPMRSSFKKEGEPVGNYGYPCAALGTVLLVVGTFLCAFVVERSTNESSWKPIPRTPRYE
jgi:hypothetical protein